MLSWEKGHVFSQWDKALCTHGKKVMYSVSGIRLYALMGKGSCIQSVG